MNVSQKYKEEHGFTPEKIADTMLALYARIDARSAEIEAKLAEKGIKLHCHAGCHHCCLDLLTVTQSEAAVIRKLFPNIGKEKPHAAGACAFLDDNGLCRIYAARPYICRTHGLPMRTVASYWEAVEMGVIEESPDADTEESFELRDICEFSEDAVDVENLEDACCWTSDVAESQLGMIELCTFGEEKRIPMRSFFE
ncbi:MAG: YkgJ family cysteine cluster protein [Proteobacteria bacterium]|nr:YkgJ family cysteine cluster protein [Pseudomonadota bacterium]